VIMPAKAAASAPMSARELTQLYKGKSWLWDDGASYFAPDHRFVAWSRNGASATYAIGRWSTGKSGQMCFKAVWYSSTGASRASTCFSHRKEGDSIAQKKDPAGQWYVFRKSIGDDGKLRTGDIVSVKVAELKAQMGRKN
jgi:hypothetical protein